MRLAPVGTHNFAMDTDAPASVCGVYVIEHGPTVKAHTAWRLQTFAGHKCAEVDS